MDFKAKLDDLVYEVKTNRKVQLFLVVVVVLVGFAIFHR